MRLGLAVWSYETAFKKGTTGSKKAHANIG